MKKSIDYLRKKGWIAAVAFSLGAFWIGSGTASMAEERPMTSRGTASVIGGESGASDVRTAAEGGIEGTRPAIAGHQKVLYRDSGDKITVLGKGIQSVQYSSGNENVAVVSDAGVVSGVDEGATEIIAQIQYEEGGETKREQLSYKLKVIDDFTNYFDFYNGDVKNLTEKGKTLKEMYLPDYCNDIRVKSAQWEKILCRNGVVEKVFLSDYMELFFEDGISNGSVAPKNLRHISLGKDLRGFGALNGASSLESFAVHPENKSFTVSDQVLFREDALNCYPAAKKDAAYTVPSYVKEIYPYAFSGAKNLAKVSLPKGLEYIYQSAFEYAGLTEVAIPERTHLSENAFAGCGKLQKVLLPRTIYMCFPVFKDCPVLKTVIVPNKADDLNGRCFENCPSLIEFQVSPGASDYQVENGVLLRRSTRQLVAYPMGKKDASYTVPKGIKSIGTGGFYGAANLKKITLDDALLQIHADGFANCGALERIRIPRRVKHIDFPTFGNDIGVFWGCDSLREITVDSQNKYFSSSKGVMYDKPGKTLLVYPMAKRGKKFAVPKKVTTISNRSIAYTRFLQKVVMGNHVKSVGQRAFIGGRSLKAVALSAKLKKLDSRCFEGCKKLTKVVLPDRLVMVRRRLFAHCTGLREVVLGKNVKTIDSQAFYDCKNLRKVVFKGKKWLGMSYLNKLSDVGSSCPFYLAGSKKYSRLTVQIPKCTKSQKKKCKKVLWGNGLHKKAKLKFAKR